MKLYIGNLSENVVETELQSLFSKLGGFVSLNIVKDRYSGSSRGFGFAEFENKESGDQAIAKFNGYSLNGAELVVNTAKEKRQRSRPKRW
ncbi:MAG: RNA-binding protein [Bdellovibrionales bacterium]|nr:RNA-binding protein [Bdellovibrionales bacterium]